MSVLAQKKSKLFIAVIIAETIMSLNQESNTENPSSTSYEFLSPLQTWERNREVR